MWCIKVPNYHYIAIFPFISVQVLYSFDILTSLPLYVTFFVSCDNFWCNDYFVWFKYCYPWSWQLSACSDGKESAWKSGDLGLIPGLGRFPGEGNGYPFQYSFLENFMDRGTWQATVHGITKSQTQLKWLSTY